MNQTVCSMRNVQCAVVLYMKGSRYSFLFLETETKSNSNIEGSHEKDKTSYTRRNKFEIGFQYLTTHNLCNRGTVLKPKIGE